MIIGVLHQQILIRKTLKNNLKQIYSNIDNKKTANQKVTLVAVTKTQPIEVVQQAIDLGLCCFGENKVQEAEKKFYDKNKNIELHLIGHLQKNKVKKAVQIFDVIQTVDSLELAEKINYQAQKLNTKQRVYCQVNIGNDPKKFGFSKQEILEFCNDISTLKYLSFEGLMTILPFNLKDIENKKLYKKMHNLHQIIKQKHPTCKDLSMGMTNDYIEAIQSGATMVRIGTALFGKR